MVTSFTLAIACPAKCEIGAQTSVPVLGHDGIALPNISDGHGAGCATRWSALGSGQHCAAISAMAGIGPVSRSTLLSIQRQVLCKTCALRECNESSELMSAANTERLQQPSC